MPPRLEPVEYDPFSAAYGAFPAFDAAAPVETQDPAERLVPSVNRLSVAPQASGDVFERAAQRQRQGVVGIDRPLAAPVTPVYKDFDEGGPGVLDRVMNEGSRLLQLRRDLLSDPNHPERIKAGFNRAFAKLAGLDGQEREQTWVEKMLRSGATLPGDVVSGTEPIYDVETGRTSARAIERVQDTAGLMVTGPLAAARGTATLGSGMTKPNDRYLVPAVKVDGKIYKGKRGQEHMDVTDEHGLGPTSENIDTYIDWADGLPSNSFGFVNHKGQFVTRKQAGEYAADNGLLNDPTHEPYARKGFLTADMLLSDSGTPGSGLSAVANASRHAEPFYSAVEHAVREAPEGSMTPEQWGGYLRNRPGVKAEELEWIGLPEGKKVSKQEMLDHAKEHGVQMKEVRKEGGDKLHPEEIADIERDYERGRLTDEEYDAALADTPGGTKFSEYQLPGGDNYREVLFTLPFKKAEQGKAIADQMPEFQRQYARPEAYAAEPENVYRSSHWDEPNVLAHARMNDRVIDVAPVSQIEAKIQAAYPDQSIQHMASGMPKKAVRDGVLTEQEAADWSRAKDWLSGLEDKPGTGLKTLHLEEIQSDWHQAGRKQGYKEEVSSADAAAARDRSFAAHKSLDEAVTAVEDGTGVRMSARKFNNLRDALSEARDYDAAVATLPEALRTPEVIKAALEFNEAGQAVSALQRKRNGVPDAPFKATWPDLVLKRMIREAAENGYDAVSWTPGEAQAARYDLSKHFDNVTYAKNHDGTFEIGGHGAGRSHTFGEKIAPEKLADYVGKDVADKILKGEGDGKLSGVDLKVGGEGMKGFYDDMLVKKANALGKKYGAKVEWKEHQVEANPFEAINSKGGAVAHFPTKAEAERWIKQMNGAQMDDIGRKVPYTIKEKPSHKIPVFRLTPQLRDVAMRKGFPLFSAGIPYPLVEVDHDPFKQDK